MAGKFVVKTASNGEIYFRLQAGNGETILKSEMYASKASALNGIESVRNNATDDARYERKTAAIGQFMFNLKAANHQVIGTSENQEREAVATRLSLRYQERRLRRNRSVFDPTIAAI